MRTPATRTKPARAIDAVLQRGLQPGAAAWSGARKWSLGARWSPPPVHPPASAPEQPPAAKPHFPRPRQAAARRGGWVVFPWGACLCRATESARVRVHRCSSREPAVRLPDAFLERFFGPPPQGSDLRDIQNLARRAVGLGRIKPNPAAKRANLSDNLGQFTNRNIYAGPDVDYLPVVVVGHQENRGLRQVVDVKKLTHRRAGSPYRHFLNSVHHCVVEFADERGNHVRCFRIEIVSRTIQVGRHRADRIKSILPAKRL